jgi:hypothetical protein
MYRKTMSFEKQLKGGSPEVVYSDRGLDVTGTSQLGLEVRGGETIEILEDACQANGSSESHALCVSDEKKGHQAEELQEDQVLV